MGDAIEVSRVLCRGAGLQLQGSSYDPLKRMLETTEFQAKLAEWLSQQCEGELAHVNTHHASPGLNAAEPGSDGGEYVVIHTDTESHTSDWSDDGTRSAYAPLRATELQQNRASRKWAGGDGTGQ